jgi:hypothetical protein
MGHSPGELVPRADQRLRGCGRLLAHHRLSFSDPTCQAAAAYALQAVSERGITVK